MGDRDAVNAYVKTWMAANQQFGVYYRMTDPHKSEDKPQRTKCLLDFDPTRDPKNGEIDWTTFYREIDKAINLVNAALQLNFNLTPNPVGECSLRTITAFNERKLITGKKKGDIKDSFHVHWPDQGFASCEEQGNFMQDTLKGKINIEYDKTMYSDNHLMRMGWCGKMKDRTACLYPSKFDFDEKTRTWTRTLTHPEVDLDLMNEMTPCPYPWDDHITYHNWKKTTKKQAKIMTISHGVEPSREEKQSIDANSSVILKFIKPMFFEHILPAVQRHRKKLCNEMCDYFTKSGVKTDNLQHGGLRKSTFNGHSKPGVFEIHVQGDSFCEHQVDGETPHHHASSSCIFLQFDFANGYYHQMCKRCAGMGDFAPKKYCIWGMNDDIKVGKPWTRNTIQKQLDIAPDEGYKAMIYSLASDMLFNPSIGDSFHVYDDIHRIWLVGKAGEKLLVVKAANWKTVYFDYREACFEIVIPLPHNATKKLINGRKSAL